MGSGRPVRPGREFRARFHCALALVATAGCLFGASSNATAAGNRGAFAALDPSARATAWGVSSVVLTERSESGRLNPAGLLRLPDREVSVSYADLFGLGLASQTQVHAAFVFARYDYVHDGAEIEKKRLPPPGRFAFGLSIAQLRGDVGFEGDGLPDESYNESEVGFSLAWRSLRGTYVGAQLRLLSADSDFADDAKAKASGSTVGFGLQRDFGAFRLGAAADNVFGSLDWNEGLDEPLPRRYSAGLGWFGFDSRIRLAGAWSALGEDGKGSTVGVAFDWRPYDVCSLRGGLDRATDVGGDQWEPSAGLGFTWQGLTIDWGFRPNGNDLGTTHRWSASVEI
ncbi:MAG: hypothetical protein R3E97_21195 [Candidatus Eisenbacteria bacterium]